MSEFRDGIKLKTTAPGLMLLVLLPLYFLTDGCGTRPGCSGIAPSAASPSPTTLRTGDMRKCGSRSAATPSAICGLGM